MLADLPRGVILLYHRVAQPRHDPYGLALPPALFASQMQVLADHWPVLSVSQGLSRLDQRHTGCWVAVTFDDAYRDILDQALAGLQPDQQLTVFACTWDPQEEFWWDRLPDPSLQPALRRHPRPQVAAPNTGAAPRLQPSQLAWLAHQGHEVGNHTHQHISLLALDASQQSDAIETARQLLQDWTGTTPRGLAYPFGDFDESAKQAAARSCQWACSTRAGWAWRGTDRYALPRHTPPRLGGREFLAWLRQIGLT